MSAQSNSADWEFIWQNMSEGMARNPGRDYRFNQIIKSIPNLKDLKILDFGCGTGNLLSLLMERFPQHKFVGADTSLEGLEKTLELNPLLQIVQIKLDNDTPTIELPMESFNLIICSEVLEHIDNDIETLILLYKLMAPGGKLICTVPAGPMSYFDKFIGHHRHYTRNSLRLSLEASGFSDVTVLRSGFPAINILRIFTILSGRKLTEKIQEPNYGDTGFSHRLITILRSLFRYSFDDNLLGWQLVSSSIKAEFK